MANINGQVTVNEVDLLEVDADPSAGGGTPAPLGSIAMVASGVEGGLWIKRGAADTAWEEVKAGFDGTVSAATVTFFRDGDMDATKWMLHQCHHASTSDKQPWPAPFDGAIKALGFSNENDAAYIDITLYKNGLSWLTWSVVDKHWSTKSDGLSSLTFVAGDKVSVQATFVGGNLVSRDTLLDLHIVYSSSVEQELGSSTL